MRVVIQLIGMKVAAWSVEDALDPWTSPYQTYGLCNFHFTSLQTCLCTPPAAGEAAAGGGAGVRLTGARRRCLGRGRRGARHSARRRCGAALTRVAWASNNAG